MALLLQPGDPVPPLLLARPDAVDPFLADFAGGYLVLAAGPAVSAARVLEAAQAVAGPRLKTLGVSGDEATGLQADCEGATARRLGLQPGDGDAAVVVVLVDPAARVVAAWAGADAVALGEAAGALAAARLLVPV